MRIALVGYGGVGRAFIKLLAEKRDELVENVCDFKVNYILNSSGGIYDPKGINCEDVVEFSSENKNICEFENGGKFGIGFDDIMKNNDIDVLIELTPTNKDTGGQGLVHIKKALSSGINVITANKGPILLAYNELNDIAKNNNVQLAIGCTTGGALPTINAGMFDLAGSEIEMIEGIFNGTTNFIIKEMEENDITYEEALTKAQKLGIAETNPKLDVEGFDTASKILILTNVLLKENKILEDVSIEGITKLTTNDIDIAKKEGKKYKLVGKVEKIDGDLKISVKLEKIESTHPLYMVDGKNKGVRFISDTLGELTMIGGASGVTPAAASILRDMINISRGYKFSGK